MKIFCLRNNITDLNTFNQGITLAEQWCSTINLPLDFTFADTTKQFTSVSIPNSMVLNGVYVNQSEILPEAYKAGYVFSNNMPVLLIYDASKITPQPTNPSDGGLVMQMPTQWYNIYPETFAIFLLHELCHFCFSKYGGTDITHLMNNRNMNPTLYDQFAQKPLKDFYLYLLKSLIPQTSQITITRTFSDTKEIIGQLRSADGKFGCDTLERIGYQIPTGTYQVKWTHTLKFPFGVYQLQVPNRTGIDIHAGNYFFDSLGCIIVGSLPQDINNDGEKDLINSRLILNAFITFMNKKDFQLNIC